MTASWSLGQGTTVILRNETACTEPARPMLVIEPKASVAVTTDAFPAEKRLEMWREIYGRTIAKFDIEPLDDAPFHAEVTLSSLPGIGIATGARSDAHYRMTRELAAQANDNLVFSMVTHGTGTICQFGRGATVEAGGAVLLSAADPSVCTLRQHGRFTTLALPRESVVPLIADLDAALVRPVQQGTDALRLLAGYLGVLKDTSTFATPDLGRSVATHVMDLAIMAIGATRDAAALAEGRGIRAARLKAMKDGIVARISDERLSVNDIARRHRVSPRYVQLLFEGDGETFSEYVLEQRLARANHMLAAARFADWTIGAIAFEAGFSNLSYFNRAFRRRYGATPSDVREAARPYR